MIYWAQSIAQPRALVPFLSTLPTAPWIMSSSIWLVGTGTIPSPVWAPGTVTSNHFEWLSPSLSSFLSSLFSWTLPWALQLPWPPGLPIPFSLLRESSGLCLSYLVCTVAWKLSHDGQLGLPQAHLVCLLSQGSLASVALCLVNCCFLYLSCLFWFTWEGKSGSCCPVVDRSRSLRTDFCFF